MQKALLFQLLALGLACSGMSAFAQGWKSEASTVVPAPAQGRYPSITNANGAMPRSGVTTGMGHGGSRPRAGAVNALGGRMGASGVVHAGQGKP
jgi:hypothetical protein